MTRPLVDKMFYIIRIFHGSEVQIEKSIQGSLFISQEPSDAKQ